MHSSSNSSEVSRNNPNLPEGWIIQLAEDGKSWNFYNEITGQVETQYPNLSQFADIVADLPLKSNRSSFRSEHSEDSSSQVKSSQEVRLIHFYKKNLKLLMCAFSLWKVGLNGKHLRAVSIFVI